MSKLGGAIAGAAGLGLVGVGVVQGIAGEDHSTRDDAGEIVEAGEVGAFRIRLGDCIASMADEGLFESVNAVPCSEPHEAEVYAAFHLADADAEWPGDAAVDREADQGCYDRFSAFVGIAYEHSTYGYGSMTPTKDSWEQIDDREVLCLITMFDGSSSSGSAEGTGQ